MLHKNEKRWSYWEAWYDEKDRLYTVHYGQVGEIGDHYAIVAEQIEGKPTHVLQNWAEEMKEKGYAELAKEDWQKLVVSFPHLSEADVEMRYAIEALLDECLGRTGNGHSDGGDDSRDELAVICCVIDMEKAIAAVQEAMSAARLHDGLVIWRLQDDGTRVSLYPSAC
ncbi:hypothetical protein [Brevibacillus agri]|nr:hypothetical protein [Brevibacillus agri]MED4568913.1 hypothetical protein [Brevibacillus agri]WHX28479.1 hypothetical protein QNK09_15260 [Brevibacillus agri]